jgi:copper chaperone
MKLQLKVPNISCGGCVSTITEAIKKVDSNATVQGNSQAKTISVETQSSETEIKAVMANIGYPAT